MSLEVLVKLRPERENIHLGERGVPNASQMPIVLFRSFSPLLVALAQPGLPPRNAQHFRELLRMEVFLDCFVEPPRRRRRMGSRWPLGVGVGVGVEREGGSTLRGLGLGFGLAGLVDEGVDH